MSYPGAKDGSGVHQAIINQMPPHNTYVEPFLGSGAVMRWKRPARVNVGCDIDPAVVAVSASIADVGGCGPGSAPGRTASESVGGSAFHFLNVDGIEYLRAGMQGPRDLVYCDPPYLMESRRGHRRLYRYELTRARHVELIDVCRRLPCMVMVSGYRSELYDRALVSWRRVEYQVRTHRGPATECLWMNYPEPVELHDYRYLGRDYREREHIRRQQARWVRRLLGLPVLEREAMMESLRVARATPVRPDGAVPE